MRRTEDAAAAAGLSGQRYNLLLMVKVATNSGSPATVSALMDRLELPQTAVTELVKRAEQAGLVQRRPGTDDRRVRHIALTAEGEARLMHAFTSLRADRAQLADGLRELTRSFESISAAPHE